MLRLHRETTSTETASAMESSTKEITLTHAQTSMISSADPVLVEQGLELIRQEKEMSFRQAIRHHWRALLWSMTLSMALVMDGYDGAIVSRSLICQPNGRSIHSLLYLPSLNASGLPMTRASSLFRPTTKPPSKTSVFLEPSSVSSCAAGLKNDSALERPISAAWLLALGWFSCSSLLSRLECCSVQRLSQLGSGLSSVCCPALHADF
jgi:SP family general alpha glucoside:H+ symporter-like MFS transporter